MVGSKIMKRRTGSESTAVSSYAEIQQQHLQTRNSSIDVNSVLTVSSSQEIQI
jgi:hypothetical protein